MRYVRYIGLAHVRQISAADWASAGIKAETVQWDFTNSFMVPADKFTDEQLEKVINPDTGFIVIGTDDEPKRLEHHMTPAQAGSPRISLSRVTADDGDTDGAGDTENASTDASRASTGAPGGSATPTRRTGRGSGKD
jgi:hypothetical protein